MAYSGVFIINLEPIYHLVLLFVVLTLSKQIRMGMSCAMIC